LSSSTAAAAVAEVSLAGRRAARGRLCEAWRKLAAPAGRLHQPSEGGAVPGGGAVHDVGQCSGARQRGPERHEPSSREEPEDLDERVPAHSDRAVSRDNVKRLLQRVGRCDARKVPVRRARRVLQWHQEKASPAVESGQLARGPTTERTVLVEQHDEAISPIDHAADGTLGLVPVRKGPRPRGRLRRLDPIIPALRAALLKWFDSNGRALDFRASTSPYGILVGEVMAQQTQVSRVEPAWRTFMARYPTARALALAPTADVLRAWAGLGYNRRAVNLQRAARRILRDHAGRVPASLAELEQLPGVGPYTARAVAAVAFGIPAGAVDTNVRRVLTRVLASPAAPSTPAEIQQRADALVDPERPADWTHALMDVGATICRPVRTDCDRCPLLPWCATARRPLTQQRKAPAPRRVNRDGPKAPVFTATSRWLRGRLVARLVAAPDDAWQCLDGPLGVHSAAQVEDALAALARDSLIERDADGRVRLPATNEGLVALARS
jgi:A/G-specific adenine glycosylase